MADKGETVSAVAGNKTVDKADASGTALLGEGGLLALGRIL
ncbi:hypothetical protein PV371_37760 [Streptomyces sp. TX20-6-3]|nr:hypothetical protein [Streptomyces sp. TX20-6-3]MDX2565320.1 hypothetical protein [Streptomyces sp. TX20-6-3]